MALNQADYHLSARPPRRGPFLAGGAVAALLLGGSVTWLIDVCLDLTDPGRGPLHTRPDDLLVLACAVAALVIVLRWLIGFLAVLVSVTPGAIGSLARRRMHVLAPRALIRLASAVLGGTLMASLPGLTATASVPASVSAWPAPAVVTDRAESGAVVGRSATPASHGLVRSATPASHRGPAAPATDVAPGPIPRPPRLPDPAWRDPEHGGVDNAASPPAGAKPVLVATGDTLWALAAQRLPASSSDAVVDRTWRAWYAANRAVVGPDPDLIFPGQRLVPPPAKEGS